MLKIPNSWTIFLVNLNTIKVNKNFIQDTNLNMQIKNQKPDFSFSIFLLIQTINFFFI